MPYDATLAGRIRDALACMNDIHEKKMFGGIGFFLGGNMLVGVWKDSLIVRLGPEAYDESLREPHVRVFDITGKPMKGWVMVQPDGIDEDGALKIWIERSTAFVRTLPPK